MHSAYKTHFLIPLTLTVILIWTSNCNAQNNWAVIATPGSPDTVTTFDLANPGGTLNELGNVATNFNRGMDYFCLLYTSPSPRDKRQSRMPSSA